MNCLTSKCQRSVPSGHKFNQRVSFWELPNSPNDSFSEDCGKHEQNTTDWMSSEVMVYSWWKSCWMSMTVANEREFREVSEAAWGGSATHVIECPLLQRGKKPSIWDKKLMSWCISVSHLCSDIEVQNATMMVILTIITTKIVAMEAWFFYRNCYHMNVKYKENQNGRKLRKWLSKIKIFSNRKCCILRASHTQKKNVFIFSKIVTTNNLIARLLASVKLQTT